MQENRFQRAHPKSYYEWKSQFSFKYRIVEVNAKLPVGDWLWPSIWLLPQSKQIYGDRSMSGEIDIMGARGNRNLTSSGGKVGVQKMAYTIHFGPSKAHQKSISEGFLSKNGDFSKGFTKFKLNWSPEELTKNKIGVDEGFWKKGDFEHTAPGFSNPWVNGTKAAPFDEEFFLILNVAVGGNYFTDKMINYPGEKPWKNDSPTAMADFWKGRQQWLHTWNYNKMEDTHYKIEYVKIWAL